MKFAFVEPRIDHDHEIQGGCDVEALPAEPDAYGRVDLAILEAGQLAFSRGRFESYLRPRSRTLAQRLLHVSHLALLRSSFVACKRRRRFRIHQSIAVRGLGTFALPNQGSLKSSFLKERAPASVLPPPLRTSELRVLRRLQNFGYSRDRHCVAIFLRMAIALKRSSASTSILGKPELSRGQSDMRTSIPQFGKAFAQVRDGTYIGIYSVEFGNEGQRRCAKALVRSGIDSASWSWLSPP